MRRTELLQEIRKMRFVEAYEAWQLKRLSQQEAARLLGVCDRTLRRMIDRYEGAGAGEAGIEALLDRRLNQVSHRRAPVDEVCKLVDLYRGRYAGWNVKHFYAWYRREHAGERSYSWVKKQLQAAQVVKKAPRRGAHRKRRERAPLPGMMVHQDGSTHPWVLGCVWDLIVTMDDATGEHLSMFFVEEEGSASSFRGAQEVIERYGLFGSLYTDRGSHYWLTEQAGGKVDRERPTQFGRAMRQLGIEMIAAYSPQARGRSERAFATHQQRLPRELARARIRTLQAANRYLEQRYRPAFNAEFAVQAAEPGSAFVPFIGPELKEILCEHHERTVGADNCVRFEGLVLQIPAQQHRCHYVKAKVRVHRYTDASLALFHGPRCLARYDSRGQLQSNQPKELAA